MAKEKAFQFVLCVKYTSFLKAAEIRRVYNKYIAKRIELVNQLEGRESTPCRTDNDSR